MACIETFISTGLAVPSSGFRNKIHSAFGSGHDSFASLPACLPAFLLPLPSVLPPRWPQMLLSFWEHGIKNMALEPECLLPSMWPLTPVSLDEWCSHYGSVFLSLPSGCGGVRLSPEWHCLQLKLRTVVFTCVQCFSRPNILASVVSRISFCFMKLQVNTKIVVFFNSDLIFLALAW